MSLNMDRVVKEYGDFKISVNIEVGTGEIVALLGPSGCGKTTTLRLIAGFVRPDSGSICLDGKTLDLLPPNKRNIGIVFQDYALFPNMNVVDNIEFGPRMQRWSRKDRQERSRLLLQLVHLDGYESRPVAQLSGGEQQRVALARALAPRPALLLLDEPLSALDARLRRGLRREIVRIQKQLGVTTVYVTHDQEEALAISDRVVVMRNGVIEQIGTPEEVYNRPVNLFVAEFVGHANLVKGMYAGMTDGTARVETELGTFAAKPTKHRQMPQSGVEVYVFFRPEACVLKEDAANRIAGRVTSSEYLGGRRQFVVENQTGQFTLTLRETPDFEIGSRISFSVDPGDCRLVF